MSPASGLTERRAKGEVVPIPTLPFEVTRRALLPTVRSEEYRLVELAVVEKRLVVVAEVEVEFVMDKLEMVEEAKDMRPPEKVMRVVVALLVKG